MAHPEVQRLTLARLLRATGALAEGEAVALGVELCRTALREPGPRRLRLLCTTNLFFTRDERLGCTAAPAGYWSYAPEQARSLSEDERTDVFGVGLMLYAGLLAGRPYAGESDLQLLQRAVAVELEPLRVPVDERLGAVLSRALAVAREDRFASLEELAAALRALPQDARELWARVREAWATQKPTAAPAPAPVDESTAGRLLERLRAGDEGARLVYADLLESEGQAAEAEWVRREHRVRQLSGAAQLEALAALRTVEVPVAFMASVARAEVETCAVTFGFPCPRRWEALTPTAEPQVRLCSACQERVYFAKNLEEAEAHGDAGRCVAVAETVVRGPGRLGELRHASYTGRGPRGSPGWKR